MAKSPSEMSDEELAEALGEEIKPKEEAPKVDKEEEPKPDEPAEEPEEQPEPEEPVAEEEPEEPEEEKPPSRRESLRVQQLIEKYGPPPAQAPAQVPDTFDLDTLEADPELIKKLQEDRKQYGAELYQQGLNQMQTAQWETLLNIDAPTMEQKYPQLDKNSKEFYPALANTLNVKYLEFVGYKPGDKQKGIPPSVERPGVRYSEFVESEMEFANELATLKVEDTTRNIAKQAAKTGLRPDGTRAKSLNLNKHPADMTDEELTAALAQDPAFR